jgi:hypothetical protein
MIFKRSIFVGLVFCGLFFSSQRANAQEMGVSFSFFFPKNGYFSIPISPFSIRGVGFNINRFLALETGISLYRFSGLSVKDVPFETMEPIIGPTITLLTPVELVLQFGNSQQQFRIKGGVFGFYNLTSQIMYGNLDRALRELEGWEVLNSEFVYDNNPGWGYEAGVEYILYFKSFGITLGANYFLGGATINMRGSYLGGSNGVIEPVKEVAYPGSQIDLTGWEISLGVLFGG